MSANSLRSFLYLDTGLTRDYLASVEGAMLEEETTVARNARDRGLAANLGTLGVGLTGKQTSATETETTRRAVLTDAATFQRLYDRLESDPNYGYYAAFDDQSWSEGIFRNRVVECEVDLKLSTLKTNASAIRSFRSLSDIVSKATGQELAPAGMREQVDAYSELADLNDGKGLPVVMRVIGTPKYSFVAHLLPEFLRVSEEQLVGEVVVFAKVRRQLQTGETFDLGPPLGQLAVNREQRRRMKKNLTAVQQTVRPPSAVVTTVAIYR
jgi:hypothetical protein